MITENKRTVLLVEDDPFTAMREKIMLEESGYNVIIENSGEKAVDTFEQTRNIDLVLMDIDLGDGIDGGEAAHQILKYRIVPIVFTSRHTDPAILNKTEKAKSYGFIIKNSGVTILSTSIKIALKLFDSIEKLEKQLSKSNEFSTENETCLQEVIENLLDACYKRNLETNAYDYMSPVFAKIFGYTPDELEALPISDVMKLIHPNDLEKIEHLISNSVFGTIGTTYRMEYRVKHKDGQYHWLCDQFTLVQDTHKNNLSHIGSIRDISELKKVENQLIENEGNYRNLFENAGDAVFICDEQSKILSANPTACERLGYTASDFISMSMNHIVPPIETLQIHKRIDRLLKDGQLSFETIHKRKDGGLIPTEVTACQVSWNGRLAIMNICRDVTNRKREDERIRNLLVEKEILLQEVHHRIKNNMNTMQSILSLQSRTIQDPAAIAALKDAGSRLLSMMVLYEKLYCADNFSELSVKKYLSTLIDKVVKNFPNCSSVEIEKNIENIVLDVKLLQSVGIIINELLTNIMKYAFTDRDSGIIVVEVSSKPVIEYNKNHITIVVQDNGIGIPESISFENSTGFGLSVVKILTAQIHGSIRIEREHGTRIVLEFNA